jgi:chloramphenicol O-acetyltransferase type A
MEQWKRKELFRFFSNFEEPFFGVTALVDVTKAYQKAKAMHTSFFIYYLHKSLCAVNALDAFKYRIHGDTVIEYDQIHASATVNKDNGTFGFSFIVFDKDYHVFEQNAKEEITRVRMTDQLFPERNSIDAVHYSSLPWLRFTALSHARAFTSRDSVPKISFGKCVTQGGKMDMPCSLHVHHGLADGIDAGDYFDLFQTYLSEG